MLFGWNLVTLLAQDGAKAEPSLWALSPPLVVMLALAFFFLVMPQRREQKKRDDFLNNLKQNDRVVTIGGMIGTIVNISTDRKEFTLKVDDSTRIKFVRTGISHKLEEPSADGKPS